MGKRRNLKVLVRESLRDLITDANNIGILHEDIVGLYFVHESWQLVYYSDYEG